MYLGKIVELAPADEFYADPRHPYSQALLSAVLIPDPTHARKRTLPKTDFVSPSAAGRVARFTAVAPCARAHAP